MEYLKIESTSGEIITFKGHRFSQKFKIQLVILAKDNFALTHIQDTLLLALNLNRTVNYCLTVNEDGNIVGVLPDYGYSKVYNIVGGSFVATDPAKGLKAMVIDLDLKMHYFKLSEFESIAKFGQLNGKVI